MNPKTVMALLEKSEAKSKVRELETGSSSIVRCEPQAIEDRIKRHEALQPYYRTAGKHKRAY